MRTLTFLVLALLAAACRDAPRAQPAPVPTPVLVPTVDAAPPLRGIKGGTDVTFVVVSDVHLGYSDMEKDNARMITRLNALEGKPFPPAIGGNVAAPRGLVITGDLTEYGTEAQWAQFVAMFGLKGTEGQLKLPVFEMVGNHDKVAKGPWVEEQVSARHGTSERFYSWDWDDLHLIALQEGPDDDGLAFLGRDLSKLAPEVPIVVFFHLAILGPWSTETWFTDAYKARFATALVGRNVVGVFHGHHHATGHYFWKGLEVWKPGAVKNDAHTFAVVHVTDSVWTLGSYDWESQTWGPTYVKIINPPSKIK